MPSALAQTATLAAHPAAPTDAVRGIDVRVARMPGGMLAVTYVIDADLARLRVPGPRPPRLADKLWEHTCCEIFVARKGMPGYHEFNFAPSGEWAAYAFECYRERAPLSDEAGAEHLDPQIIVRDAGKKLELNALVLLDKLSRAHSQATLSLALAAVVEDWDGSLSYWALAHPPGKPDFHHPDAFALTLDEVRD